MRRESFSICRGPLFAAALLVGVFGVMRISASVGIGGKLEGIPVDRLIHNLEDFITKDPTDAHARINLARVHSMAFALKSSGADEFRTQTIQGRPPALFFDPGATGVPFTVKPTTDPDLTKTAAEHLARAIDLYRQGLEMDQSNIVAKLGYGWCLDKAGDRARAIAVYRQVVLEGWTREARVDSNGRLVRNTTIVGASITGEAATYLIPLLDPNRDREEIATLQERIRLLGVGQRSVSPIVIPLTDEIDAAKLIDTEARVSFEADGSGVRKTWTWIKPSAGWLVHAPAGVRSIDSALQMFGNVTFWLFWDDGYHALRSLDDDGNGVLEGPELRDLAVWRDANGNGLTDEGELKPLSDWGIVAIDCAHEETRGREDYMAFSAKGVTFKDGRTRPTYDIILHPKRTVTE